MSRWIIEKDGTGIEKSGTGIEKAGTGIEKSGTGIEKSGTGIEKAGTGIEKAGTGIRRALMAVALGALTCAGSIQAAPAHPAGSLQLVVSNDTVAVSWIIGDSVFSGVSSLTGSYANLMLTEVRLGNVNYSLDVTGNGTGSNTQVTGNGTGSSNEVTGNGTGTKVKVTGNGTGGSVEVTGNGTGGSVQVTGNGTGGSVQVTGNGTGGNVQVTGNGTGGSSEVTGNGTGTEAIVITLPEGTGMSMEVSLGCNSALVSVIDSDGIPVVNFENVAVIGDAGLCGSGGFDAHFARNPGQDFYSRH
jgi:hypothetical protein